MELKIKTFVIFDPHFGWKNYAMANRPFSSVKEMDDAMIYNWNSVVIPSDLVIVGGDFCSNKHPEDYFNRLNGKKMLLMGNHDYKETLRLPWEKTVNRLELPPKHYGRRIVLDHYPLHCWNGSNPGPSNPTPPSYHIHGHVHDKPIPYIWNRICASVELIHYTPIELQGLVHMIDLRVGRVQTGLEEIYGYNL